MSAASSGSPGSRAVWLAPRLLSILEAGDNSERVAGVLGAVVSVSILWLRRDLRLEDHGALRAAAQDDSDGVVALFVLDPILLRPAGANRRRFLADSLRALDVELGGTLVVRRGAPAAVLTALASELGARTVYATTDYGLYGVARDRAVARALSGVGCELNLVDSPYAVAPGTLCGRSGAPLRVFAAFRRAFEAVDVGEPIERVPVRFLPAPGEVAFEDLAEELAAQPPYGIPNWWGDLPLASAPRLPVAGAPAARHHLKRFVADRVARYAEDRDRPALDATSRLSPYLHFGALHPRTALAAHGGGEGLRRWRDELIWREFYADVLWHQPQSARRSLAPFGEHLRWDRDRDAQRRFAAWATGTTGYAFVDAGMRQLLSEGWMHNRLRMVTASFLVKDLHIDWRWGARWFMWHLVDGDLASNQHGWQWVAGTGTDAAPFHRIFNPLTQQARFDPDGEYVRRHLQESDMTVKAIVDHALERREALARFREAREDLRTRIHHTHRGKRGIRRHSHPTVT